MEIKKNIKKFLAWKRCIVFGFCPNCNSDAPELYDCSICHYDTRSPFNKKQRKILWNRFKEDKNV